MLYTQMLYNYTAPGATLQALYSKYENYRQQICTTHMCRAMTAPEQAQLVMD